MSLLILGISSVVTSSQATVVVSDSYQVIDCPLVLSVDDVVIHAEISDGEVNVGVDLVAPEPIVGEALEVYDEHSGQAPQVKLLGGLLVAAACGAVPGVLGTQLLGCCEQLQALAQL
uniref:Putative secreted protein ovary overexpressed n=1 Tax=Rhipicephalus microplus TaxID=6941 RepID=A0A6M2D9H4_RHIMP